MLEKFPKLRGLQPEQENRGPRIKRIEDENGTVVDLSFQGSDSAFTLREFVPPGVTLAPRENKFAYDPDSKRLQFDPALIDSPGGCLVLLHEVGHAIDLEGHEEIVEQLHTLKDVAEKIQQASLDVAIEEDREATAKLPESERDLLLRERLIQKIKQLNIPQDKLTAYATLLARNERVAWAEGLKLYRTIKRDKDIDLLSGIKNRQIIEAITDPLQSYDDVFRELLPDQRMKLFVAKQFGEAADE